MREANFDEFHPKNYRSFHYVLATFGRLLRLSVPGFEPRNHDSKYFVLLTTIIYFFSV